MGSTAASAPLTLYLNLRRTFSANRSPKLEFGSLAFDAKRSTCTGKVHWNKAICKHAICRKKRRDIPEIWNSKSFIWNITAQLDHGSDIAVVFRNVTRKWRSWIT